MAAEREKIQKIYIGDGIYADDQGYALMLTTENDITIQNRIVIELRELSTILLYVKRMWGENWNA